MTQMQLPSGGLQPPIISSAASGWKHILVEEFCQPPGEENYQSSTTHTLCISLNRRPSRLSQVMGDRRHTSLCLQGDISITPANSLLFSQWDREDQYLRLRIASEFLEHVAHDVIEIGANRLKLLPEFRTRNLEIAQLGMMFLNELRNGEPTGKLYIESLTNVLSVHLLRYSATKSGVIISDGGLSDRQLRQVTDYISDRLAEDIQLSSLAELLGMSQFHFSRLFKQSTGVSPYQYVLQQRVERAKQLLKTTDLPIMDIALLCGFSSHSHLGKWFRQYTGMSPKAFRVGG